ncbi:MAG: Gfo/Idh/MocA family oxidoreductase [Verrucomicrobiota bacterium]|nr:Gfo/Idh/MocA family oxidoreductase [Verrucomicrobiota bacterium]
MKNPETLSTRRELLRNSSAAIAAGGLASTIGFPTILTGAPTSEKLKIGFIGCGGRGTGAANQALTADSNVVLWAVGDAFEDKIQTSLASLEKIHANKIDVPKERQFVGLDAYQKVIDSGVDVVLLTTPPAFRPAHFKAAVAAGKHCFLEKPMATDAPGVRSVLETVEEAKKKKLGVLAGFCWRYHPAMRETFQRLQDGAIGQIVANYNTYNTGSVDRYPKWDRQNTPRDLEWQVRRWYYFTWLSGDHIVEQGCHSIDKMAWAMGDKPPLKCVGHGGRQVRSGEDYGNIFDHFSIVYDYDQGMRGFHFSRQINRTAASNADTFFGSEGLCEINGSLKQFVIKDLKGNLKWRYTQQGPPPDMYQVEHDEFFDSIRIGEPLNDGPRMASSTLLAIMGRMAAYTGQEITWDMAIKSQERIVPEKMDWEMKLPVAPVAMPGITEFA